MLIAWKSSRLPPWKRFIFPLKMPCAKRNHSLLKISIRISHHASTFTTCVFDTPNTCWLTNCRYVIMTNRKPVGKKRSTLFNTSWVERLMFSKKTPESNETKLHFRQQFSLWTLIGTHSTHTHARPVSNRPSTTGNIAVQVNKRYRANTPILPSNVCHLMPLLSTLSFGSPFGRFCVRFAWLCVPHVLGSFPKRKGSYLNEKYLITVCRFDHSPLKPFDDNISITNMPHDQHQQQHQQMSMFYWATTTEIQIKIKFVAKCFMIIIWYCSLPWLDVDSGNVCLLCDFSLCVCVCLREFAISSVLCLWFVETVVWRSFLRLRLKDKWMNGYIMPSTKCCLANSGINNRPVSLHARLHMTV